MSAGHVTTVSGRPFGELQLFETRESAHCRTCDSVSPCVFPCSIRFSAGMARREAMDSSDRPCLARASDSGSGKSSWAKHADSSLEESVDVDVDVDATPKTFASGIAELSHVRSFCHRLAFPFFPASIFKSLILPRILRSSSMRRLTISPFSSS
jgi:hypothetical protein